MQRRTYHSRVRGISPSVTGLSDWMTTWGPCNVHRGQIESDGLVVLLPFGGAISMAWVVAAVVSELVSQHAELSFSDSVMNKIVIFTAIIK